MSEQNKKEQGQGVTAKSELYLWELKLRAEPRVLFQTPEDKEPTRPSTAKRSVGAPCELRHTQARAHWVLLHQVLYIYQALHK